MAHLQVIGPWMGRREAASVSDRTDSGFGERFDAVAMPHMADLFRAAVRMTGDRAQAEDVVQEVYLQAWKSFERFEPGTNCRAWLFKILFYCLQHHRRRWFRFPFLKDAAEDIETRVTYTAPLPEHLTDQDILAALDRIPGDLRAAVMLVDVEDFSYKEAADIMNVPIGTVMSRLSRARKRLREQLAGVALSYGIGKADQEGIRQ